MANLEKLSTLAHRLSLACLALIVFLAAGGLVGGLYLVADPAAMVRHFDEAVVDPSRITMSSRLAILGINGIVLAVIVAALSRLHTAFKAMAAGDPFNATAVIAIRGAGVLLVASILAGIVARSLTTVLLTLANPPGQRAVSISISSTDLLGLLAAGALFALGLVLAIAAEIEAENRGFI